MLFLRLGEVAQHGAGQPHRADCKAPRDLIPYKMRLTEEQPTPPGLSELGVGCRFKSDPRHATAKLSEADRVRPPHLDRFPSAPVGANQGPIVVGAPTVWCGEGRAGEKTIHGCHV